VPRSMPIENGAWEDMMSRLTLHASVRLPDVQLELPFLLAIALVAPQLERAELGDLAFDGNRHDGVLVARRGQGDLERSQLLELLLPIVDDRAGNVSFSNRRAEEPKFGRLPNGQAEFTSGQPRAGTLLHPERNDAQGLHWRGQAGNGGQR